MAEVLTLFFTITKQSAFLTVRSEGSKRLPSILGLRSITDSY